MSKFAAKLFSVSKIKVLRIINRFSVGGPTFHVCVLTQGMEPEFETVLVGGLPEEHEADSFYITDQYGIKPYVLEEFRRSLNPFCDFKAYRKLRALIREFQPDIVHTHASKAGALGRLAAKHEGVKVILHTFHGHVFQGYFGFLKTQFYLKLERYLAKQSQIILAISELQKKDLADVYRISPNRKIRVVPLGLNLRPFLNITEEMKLAARQELGISKNVTVIGIVGRLVPIKNHAFFLQVLAKLFEHSSQAISVYIIGDGSESDKLKSQASTIRKNEQQKIIFTSWVQNMASYYAAFDLVCLSSKNEGTPVTLIEAQASGLPVVSTQVGGIPDVVEDGKSGILVPSQDITSYLNAMLLLIENKNNLRQVMGMSGRKSVENRFSDTRLVGDMQALYHELLK